MLTTAPGSWERDPAGSVARLVDGTAVDQGAHDLALDQAALEGGVLGQAVQALLADPRRRLGIEQHEIGGRTLTQPTGLDAEQRGWLVGELAEQLEQAEG